MNYIGQHVEVQFNGRLHMETQRPLSRWTEHIKLKIKPAYGHLPSIPSIISLVSCLFDSSLVAGGGAGSFTAERKQFEFRMLRSSIVKTKYHLTKWLTTCTLPQFQKSASTIEHS